MFGEQTFAQLITGLTEQTDAARSALRYLMRYPRQ